MAFLSNFPLVGCPGELEEEIRTTFEDFLPDLQSNNSTLHSEVRSGFSDSDSDNDNDFDDFEETVQDSDVSCSPLIQSRMKQFVSGETSESKNTYEILSSDDDSDIDGNDEHDVNSDIRESLHNVSSKCTKKCLSEFEDNAIIENRLNVISMNRDAKDMLIIGHLQACGTSKGNESRGDYQYQNKSICKSCYMFVNGVNIHYLKNLRGHFLRNGAVPCVHGNTGKSPKHAVTFDDVKKIVQFITRYADEVGMPQPAAPSGRDSIPPVYLPGRETCKSVHEKYQKVSRDENIRCLSAVSFRRIWRKCLPHIVIMNHRTDVCHKCETYREQIVKAVTEEDKLLASNEFSSHIYTAQKERDYYRARCQAATKSLEERPKPKGPVTLSSADIPDVHYTFDFAQSVLLPSHCRQEGSLYFRSPYKANLFGICNDGRLLQTNYVFGEDQSMGVDGGQSHSANAVVSMLHHYLSTYSEGEKVMYLNADNCGGQNKNQVVTSYLAWRVANGLHQCIYLHFMKPYHARCMVDGMFGLIRRKIRRSDIDSLGDLKMAIEASSKHNKAKLMSSVSENSWQWYDWKGFFKSTFRAVPGIAKNHHFHFSSTFPGLVKVKKSVDGEEKDVRLVKRGKHIPECLPTPVEPQGLSPTRAWYLYRQIRPFVRGPHKDDLCPVPSTDEIQTGANVTEE